MAKPGGKLPSPIERRELLYGSPKRAPDFEALALAYLEAGRRSDALEFAERLADPGRKKALFGRVRKEALAEGNHFLLSRFASSEPLDAAEWRQAALNAKGAGRPSYALKCALAAKDEGLIAELRALLGLAPLEPPAAPATDAAAPDAGAAPDASGGSPSGAAEQAPGGAPGPA